MHKKIIVDKKIVIIYYIYGFLHLGSCVTGWNDKKWSLQNYRNLIFSNGRIHDQIIGFTKGGENAGPVAS